MTPTKPEKKYTQADAKAEIARAIAGTIAARKQIFAALQTIRRVGKESGFKELADKGELQLTAGATGQVVTYRKDASGRVWWAISPLSPTAKEGL